MSTEKTTPDDGPAPDPFEAELVAYLDGELDDAAARKVEARLAKDPAARARAAELKKSFDLLDYLPKSEPSSTFTTRTLDKLPTVKPVGTASPHKGQATTQPTVATHANTKPTAVRAVGVSTSMPIPLDDEPATDRASQPRRLLWAAGLVVAVTAFAALGYFATSLTRSYLFSDRAPKVEEPPVDAPPRAIELLPLYAGADDISFITELAKPELFGEEPAVVYDTTLKIPSTDTTDKATSKHTEALTKQFRSLPAARKAEIIRLDQELHAKEPKERDRLLRILGTYAAWLERLPEADRRNVLSAATAMQRVQLIRQLREQQWLASLPPAVRAKPELVQQWKEEEALRRDRLAFIRQHAEEFAANKSPWPFDTAAGQKEVIDYARNVFKIDDIKRCRLSLADLGEYRRTLAVAQRDEAWAWYGLMVYELSKAHPYLPESDNAKLMISEPSDLPEIYSRNVFKKGGGWRIKPSVIGKWPEFPLEVRELGFVKFLPPNSPQLGPSRVMDFKQPVREFAYKQLFPKLTSDEKRDLQRLEGKWPEYPQRFLYYAHKHDLSVPGVMLPGSPKKWDATYGIHSSPRGNK